ncbi:MAG TPA: IPT/TIG domain-containing protein [Solirubrobacteraceae bacterium]
MLALVLLCGGAFAIVSPSAYASVYGPSGGGSGVGARAAASPLAETAPKVTKNPAGTTVEEGQTATFTATASGTAPLSAQWEASSDGGASWSPAGSASETSSSASISIPVAKASESGNQYRVTFSNKAGSATSKTATLTVHSLPAITHQPQSVAAEAGQSASFEATASGNPAPTVQWQTSTNGGTSWGNVSGATSTTLTIKSATATNNAQQYRAVFKNIVGPTTSEAATLTVQSKPVVKTQPFNAVTKEGEEAKFLCIGSGTPNPAEQWEVSTDEGVSWSPISGATAEFLSLPSVTMAMTGNEYRASFSNSAGSTTGNPATLTVDTPPSISGQPENETVEVGEAAQFEVAATGTPTPTVQWELSTNGGINWSPISGASSDVLSIASAASAESGHEFRATFKNAVGTQTSEAATLTVATTHFGAVAWGSNSMGQLGDGNTENRPVPGPVSGLKFVSQVAAGGRHSLALLLSGTVMSWGYNGFGQLGEEGIATSSTPVQVAKVRHAVAIAAGGNHSLALLANGTVMAWGDNESGQLGDGTTEEREVPVEVKGLTGVKAIAAGEEFSMALLANGTVMAWGDNELGQLGVGGTKNNLTPSAVKGLSAVKAIAAGSEFALALLEDGTVESWGSDESAQLANTEPKSSGGGGGEEEEVPEPEPESFSSTPHPVVQLSDVKAIAAGKNHALALLDGGTVMGWGDDNFGEVGNGVSGVKVKLPKPVSGLSAVSQIAAGSHDSVALLTSGALMTWGTEKFGVLGNGETTGLSDVPVVVSGLSEAFGISAGATHMLAIAESLPTISFISPHSGPLAGGTRVTISGSELGGATAVKFGKTAAASFTVESESTIVATAPASSSSGTVDVTVTTASGTSPTGAADRFAYAAAPVISKVSVKGGPASGGTTVTITGTGLTGVTEVSFGAAESTQVTVHSPSSLTVISPASTAGTVHLTATSAGGTSAASKAKYKYTPAVESVSPSSGPVKGGETVTVTGSGFAPGTSESLFKFGKKKATGVDCTSSTSCTVVVPAGTVGTVDVGVTVRKAKSKANPPVDQYSYTA